MAQEPIVPMQRRGGSLKPTLTPAHGDEDRARAMDRAIGVRYANATLPGRKLSRDTIAEMDRRTTQRPSPRSTRSRR